MLPDAKPGNSGNRRFFPKSFPFQVSHRYMKKLLILPLAMIATVLPSPGAARSPLDAFPAAAEGQVRHVVQVPPAADEDALKVELVLGKTVKTDGVNRHFFGGKLETKDLKGWGYQYYELKELGPMAGTLMAPAPGSKPVDTFVPVRTGESLLRYNSRMPIVVYVPEGVEVRYRLLQAGKTEAAPKG